MDNETNSINAEELEKVAGGALNMKQAIEIAERVVDMYRNIKHVTNNREDKKQFHSGDI